MQTPTPPSGGIVDDPPVENGPSRECIMLPSRLSQTVKCTIAVLTLCATLFFAYVSSWHRFVDAYFAERESRRVLAAASTAQQLQAAVGSLGVFYTFPDRSWLAIRYRDSHASIWSVAVARDSGGNWYESREHFCAAFSVAQLEQRIPASVLPDTPSDARAQWLRQLGASPDLGSARQCLAAHFTKIR